MDLTSIIEAGKNDVQITPTVLKFIFYKKGAKISWLQDFLQILFWIIGAVPGGKKCVRNLATTKL